MDDGSRISWLIVILLLFAAMYFAIAETAFASVSRNRLKIGADKGDARAKHALFIKDNFDRAITTILIGTNIVHLAAASIVTVTVTKLWGLSAVTASTFVTTLAVFFFGEMLPKSIARKYSEKFSYATAGTLRFLMAVLKPFAAALTWIGNAAASLTKGDPEVSVTEEEIYDIIEDMTEEGTLDEDQGDLISSALQFGDVTVESILTSRVDVAAIDVAAPQATVLAFIKGQPHSRIPVYEGTIDNIIGILQVRKYIKAYLNAKKEAAETKGAAAVNANRPVIKGDAAGAAGRQAAKEFTGRSSKPAGAAKKSSNLPALEIKPLLDEPFFVHQSIKIDDLLRTMSQKQINMAIVTDNYGGTLGIVTVEDILEELVGEIWDEDDRAVRTITKLPDGSLSVNAEEQVLDVLDEFDIDVDDEEAEELENKILSELVYENFPEIPEEGDHFEFHGLAVTVQTMRNNRILKVRIRKTDETGDGNSVDTERSGKTEKPVAAGAGAKNAGADVKNAGAGVKNTGAGVKNAGAGVKNTGAGVKNAGADMKKGGAV